MATGDTQRACQVLYITVYPPGQIAALVVAVVTLSLINLWLGIGVMLGLPVLLFIMHMAARLLRKRSLGEQQSLAEATGNAADLVAGARVLNGLHAEDTASGIYRGVSRRALRKTLSARMAYAAFNGVTTTGAQLFAVFVTLAATILAFNGLISAGELITASGVAIVMIVPVNELVGTLGAVRAVSQASSQRVLDLLKSAPHPATAGQLEVLDETPTLTIKNVHVDGVNIDGEFSFGEFVVLDLPQHAGTQLAEVLSLQRIPEQGEVTIADLPLGSIHPEVLRRHLLVVPHRPGMFAGTVLDNIRRAGPEVFSEEQAQRALEIVALSESELLGGNSTEISDGAWELSGGQRQRIALARGIVASPPILVLVEPTTSVDAVTESQIATNLYSHRKGFLTVVITSSPVFHAVADRVIASEKVSRS
ncbi:ABC transporter ATPase [Corynebacterium suranareeae]|uniref:ABC transporter ATPase n=1 Tax=Corynebacterium suranareeae TaxID=2506452 RepID=A0A160PQC0_9CORY|nr:ABC transporter ATPase [Corynebacterium suranareeae]